jgi:anti-sigma-K factor RskA
MNENAFDREAMLDLVAAYALGVLPASEAAHVAAFILVDSDARREFETLRSTANLVGMIAEEPVDSTRSARMKERLLAAVRADAVAPQRTRSAVTSTGTVRSSAVWGTALAAAAAVVFALVSVIQNFSLRSDLAEAQRRAATLATEAGAARASAQHANRMLADLTAPDATRYPVAYGTVVRRGAHVYLALTSLPPVPRGHVYQAWTLAKGAKAVAPSVTFSPNANGETLVPLPEDANRLAAVALSVEPDGGSKSPTTKPAFIQPLT